MVRQMTILTDFGNLHISLKQKDVLPKKLSSGFCHTLDYHHKNMSEIDFSTLAAKFKICLIFTERHS